MGRNLLGWIGVEGHVEDLVVEGILIEKLMGVDQSLLDVVVHFVVDEDQHFGKVFLYFVMEILGTGQTPEKDTGEGAGGDG